MTSGKTGWLSPEGKLYECETWEHMDTSEKLVKEFNYDYEENREDEALLNNGWVKISISTFMDHGYVVEYSVRKLSQEQLNFLKPYIYGNYELPMVERDREDLLSQLGEEE